MRILSLTASNIKRLHVVEITPKGNVVEIAGKNGHGKTSVLDSIMWALTGKGSVQRKPIRDGEDKALIRLGLGDEKVALVVTRRFNATPEGDYTTALTVERADGFRPQGAQSLLNAMMDELAIDPVAFQRAVPKERVAILKKLVPGVDFEAMEKEREKLYQARLDLGRKHDIAKGTVAGIEEPDESTPDKPVDTTVLRQRISDAAERARTIADIQAERANMIHAHNVKSDLLVDRVSDIREAEANLVEMKRVTNELAAAVDESQRRLTEVLSKPLPDPPDVESIKGELASAEEVNEAVTFKRLRAERQREADALGWEYDKKTEMIAGIDAGIAKAVAEADLPVRGMALGLEDVMLDGVPFDQAADSRQLRASVAIAMARQPELKIIRIRDGSLLDDDSFAVMAEVAQATGYQVWIESVTPHSPEAVIMEEGRVSEAGAKG